MKKGEIPYMAYHHISSVALVVKNPPANARDTWDKGLILGLGRFPGGGYDNPLQYSCLENPMDRGAWCATIYRVTKSWTGLKWLSMHVSILLESEFRLFPLFWLLYTMLQSSFGCTYLQVSPAHNHRSEVVGPHIDVHSLYWCADILLK